MTRYCIASNSNNKNLAKRISNCFHKTDFDSYVEWIEQLGEFILRETAKFLWTYASFLNVFVHVPHGIRANWLHFLSFVSIISKISIKTIHALESMRFQKLFAIENQHKEFQKVWEFNQKYSHTFSRKFKDSRKFTSNQRGFDGLVCIEFTGDNYP